MVYYLSVVLMLLVMGVRGILFLHSQEPFIEQGEM